MSLQKPIILRAAWLIVLIGGFIPCLAVTDALTRTQAQPSVLEDPFKLPLGNPFQGCVYIDRSGRVAIPRKFADASSFSEGLACVGIGGESDVKYACIDRTGKVVFEAKGEAGLFSSFREGLAEVNGKNGKIGFIDLKGRVVIPFRYEMTMGFEGAWAAVRKGDKWGYIDRTGKTVIPFKYEWTMGFQEGLAQANQGSKCGFISTSDEFVIKPQFEETGPFGQGLAAVCKDGQWGYIDRTGTVVIPVQFDEARRFSDGLAAVRKDGQWGYIDKSGRLVIPMNYDNCGPFVEGLAWVSTFQEGAPRRQADAKTVFIDKTGKTKFVSPLPAVFAEFQRGLALLAGGDDAWAYIDRQGKIVAATKKRGEGIVVVDGRGQVVWEDK